MLWPKRRLLRHFWCEAKGGAAVEFAVVCTVFLLVVGGMVDFGHAYYMRQVITNGSREGARYGVTYRTDTNGNRIAPSALSPTIQNYLLTGYFTKASLPSDANLTITPAGTGYTTGTKGANLEVKVAARKNWLFLPGFLPGLGDHVDLSATTVMQCE
jgi:Flp pilus assembly protein TadG